MDDQLPVGGFAAYADRVREDHIRQERGRCSCGHPLCPQRYLLDYIDQLTRNWKGAQETVARTETERDDAVRLLKCCTGMGDELSHAERVEVLRSQLAQTTRERDEARAAIRDIDAHATPVGLLHEDYPDGSPHHYIVTVGALHRALGKSDGTGVKCDVERELLRWLHAEAAWHRDRLGDEALKWTETAGQHAEEIEQLHAELDAVKAQCTALVAQWERDARPNMNTRGRGEAMLECARQLWMLLGQPHIDAVSSSPYDTSGISDQALVDLLALVCVTVSPERMAEWTPEQREEAANWAVATHLDASDNHVSVPPRPVFLAGQPDIEAIGETAGPDWSASLNVVDFGDKFGQILCDEHSPVAVRIGDRYLPVVGVEPGETVDGGHSVVVVAGTPSDTEATEQAEQPGRVPPAGSAVAALMAEKYAPSVEDTP